MRQARIDFVVLAELGFVEVVVHRVLIDHFDDPITAVNEFDSRRDVQRVAAGVVDALAIQLFTFNTAVPLMSIWQFACREPSPLRNLWKN